MKPGSSWSTLLQPASRYSIYVSILKIEQVQFFEWNSTAENFNSSTKQNIVIFGQESQHIGRAQSKYTQLCVEKFETEVERT